MATTWAADTEPNERFCLYTRGNVGEVFPNVITALTGTLIGESVRASQVDLFVELGVLRPAEVTGPSMGTGVFSGYLYMNGSAMRLFGVRMPGMNPTTATSRCSAPSRTSRRTSRRRATGTWPRRSGSRAPASGCSAAPTSRRSTRRAATPRTGCGPCPTSPRARDAELLQWLTTYPPRIGASMQRLLRSGLVASAPWTMLERILERAGAEPGLVTRLVAGTGDVDSAQPAHRLWHLGRMVAGDPALTAAFDAGLDGIAERTRDSALQPELTAFLADHGHRGNDEYELATPAWVMDPGPVYAAIDRLRHVPDDRDPEATARRLQRRRGRRTGGGDGARGPTAAGDPPAHGERRPTGRHRT